jgi:hypothetical protein
MQRSLFLFLFMFAICSLTTQAQDTTHTERKKVRYLKRLEKKNERYVQHLEKKTRKLLVSLSAKESKLIASADSTHRDSSITKNNFTSLSNSFDKGYSELGRSPQTINSSALTLGNVPEKLDARIQSYLKQQITTSAYLNDTSCSTCKKLKKEEAKAQKVLSETSKKLEYLKSIQDKIKQRQNMLQGYFGDMPQYASQLEGMEKNCFYFTQGMNGFTSIFTSSAAGVENSMMQNLNMSKGFANFSSSLKIAQIPGMGLNSGAAPNLNGYQTIPQVQSMLPQNAQGISVDQKNALVQNMQNSMTKFSSMRLKHPEIGAFKDKPKFKVNPFKGLPLRQRLVFGKEFQMHPRTAFTPVTMDIGATLGFKLTARVTPLIGVAYKLGMGQAIQNMQLSAQGIIVRGGFDTKLIYGFSLRCLYEETLKTNLIYINEKQSKTPEPSFIIGLMNKISIGKKASSTFMLGYDFLYMSHYPVASPWVVRIGFQ